MKAIWLAILATAALPPGATEKLVAEAKLTLPEMLEKGAKEGTPVGAVLKEEKGRLLYQLRIAKGEETTRIAFDARSGEQVEKAVEKKSYATALAGAKLSVAKATEIALRKVPGKAYAAKLGLEKGKAVYEVRVLAGAKRHEVEIDAATGAVLDDDEEDDDDEDDEDDDDD